MSGAAAGGLIDPVSTAHVPGGSARPEVRSRLRSTPARIADLPLARAKHRITN